MVQKSDAGVSTATSTLQAALTSSVLVSTVTTLVERTSTAFEHSRVGTVVAAVGQCVRSSKLYRWTTEPPDGPITVDLNDAVFGGVVARAIRLVTETGPTAVQTSTLIDTYRGVESAFVSAPIRASSRGVLAVAGLGVLRLVVFGPVTTMQAVLYGGLVLLGIVGSRIDTSWDALSDATVIQLWRGEYGRE